MPSAFMAATHVLCVADFCQVDVARRREIPAVDANHVNAVLRQFAGLGRQSDCPARRAIDGPEGNRLASFRMNELRAVHADKALLTGHLSLSERRSMGLSGRNPLAG